MMADNDSLLITRLALGAFTPENPLILGPAMMDSVIEDGRLDDVLDRIVVIKDLGQGYVTGTDWKAGVRHA